MACRALAIASKSNACREKFSITLWEARRLDRDAIKWFKPVKGQLPLYYRQGADHLE